MDKNEFNSSLYRPIIITFDGTGASGKGTLVKGLKSLLDNRYSRTLDAGAMYRAITQHYMNGGIDAIKLVETCGNSLDDKLLNEINFGVDENGQLFLNDELMTKKHLRGSHVDDFVSSFGELDSVKNYIVNFQKELVSKDSKVGWILDGRCMGSAVAPQAQAKFYVDSHIMTRSAWRLRDYIESGDLSRSVDEVRLELEKRDTDDMNTRIAPLVKPRDSIEHISTAYSPNAGVERVFDYVKKKIIQAGKL